MPRNPWQFDDPPNVAVITTRSVVVRRRPIIRVCRDEPDGDWQFLSEEGAVVEDAMVVALSAIVEMDRTIEQLADLPLGWVATRSSSAAPWVRRVCPPEWPK